MKTKECREEKTKTTRETSSSVVYAHKKKAKQKHWRRENREQLIANSPIVNVCVCMYLFTKADSCVHKKLFVGRAIYSMIYHS